MKILVTGATGFIGNYVIEELLTRQVKVIATSTNTEKAQLFSWYNKVEYVPFDLKSTIDELDLFDFFKHPNKLIHLAWEGLPNYKDGFHVEENLPRHFDFLKNLIQNGLKDITVTGTCFEYGMKEGCLDETMKCEPANPYAIAKNELRKKMEQLCIGNQVDFKWARLFYMYGQGQSSKSLISQLDKAINTNEAIFNMSGGEQERDFLPVKKVAENIVEIALQNKVTGAINCCSGTPITVKQFVLDYLAEQKKTIELNLGYYPYTDYEPMRFWGDNKKLKTITDNRTLID